MFDLWQALFLLLASLLILFQAVRGWRLGVVRQISRLIALALGYATVRLQGGILAPFLGSLGIPEAFTHLLSGLIIGLGIYNSINLIGAIVLKRTSHQSVSALKFAYGIGGAVIGLGFGLFLAWMLLIGVRLLGTVAQSEIQTANLQENHPAKSDNAKARKQEVSGLVAGLASLKNSMEQGHAGVVADAVDPVPTQVYSTLTKIAQLISDEAGIDRFLAYPGAQVITAHPRMVALTSDAGIAESLEKGNYMALLANPNILAAANDPDLAELVKRFELERALDEALAPRKVTEAPVAGSVGTRRD